MHVDVTFEKQGIDYPKNCCQVSVNVFEVKIMRHEMVIDISHVGAVIMSFVFSFAPVKPPLLID